MKTRGGNFGCAAFRVAAKYILSRPAIFSVVSALTLSTTAMAVNTPPKSDLSFLLKYTNQKNVGQPGWKSIWDDKTFRDAVQNLIGKDAFQRVQKKFWKGGHGVESALRNDNILIVSSMKPHDASDNQLDIFVNLGLNRQDPNANTLQACLREGIGSVVHPDYHTVQTWFATGHAPRSISDPALCSDDLDSLHQLQGPGTVSRW